MNNLNIYAESLFKSFCFISNTIMTDEIFLIRYRKTCVSMYN